MMDGGEAACDVAHFLTACTYIHTQVPDDDQGGPVPGNTQFYLEA